MAAGHKAALTQIPALALEVAIKSVASLSSPCLSYRTKKGQLIPGQPTTKKGVGKRKEFERR